MTQLRSPHRGNRYNRWKRKTRLRPGVGNFRMNQAGPNPYLRTRVLTATPQELRLMLYDGALKFCRQAMDARGKEDIETAYNGLMRAQKIVLELSSSLKHDVDPELTSRLSGLYTYIYKLLVDANVNHTTVEIEEALKLLEYERETWQMLMAQLAEQDGVIEDDQQLAADQQTAMSTLSTNA